jgi:two-component system, NarL family, response regulator DevR
MMSMLGADTRVIGSHRAHRLGRLDMVKVFLVDDHEVVRRGLIDLLASDPDLEVVGEAGSVSEALARIPALRPDVAVLDVRLPDGNGIELCRDLLSDAHVIHVR